MSKLAPPSICPSRVDLQSYLLGIGDSDTQAMQAAHVETCVECQSTLDDMSGATDFEDPLVFALRSVGEPASVSREIHQQGITRTKLRLQRLMSQASSECQEETLPFVRLGKYQLESRLGRGGMGDVYTASHMVIQRQFALKVLPSEWVAIPRAVERFHNECVAGGKLRHDNIAHVTDAGIDQGTHYVVMELIDGIDLQRLSGSGIPLRIADICEMLRQAANGLVHMHNHDLVHRDIKPSNVMLQYDGTVKIVDLGLVLLGDRRGQEPTCGPQLGTPGYMAPEQGDAAKSVDHRADLFAIGCTLFKLLAGVTPTLSDPRRSIAQQLDKSRNDIPKPLSQLITRLLERDPEARPDSCQEVIDVLEPLAKHADLRKLAASCGDKALVAPSTSAGEGLGRGRLGRWLTLGPLVALIILCGLIVTIRDKDGKVLGLYSLDNDATLSIQASPEADFSTTGVFDVHQGPVWAAALVPGKNHALSGSDSGPPLLWSMDDGSVHKYFKVQESRLTSLCISPDGRLAVTGEEGTQQVAGAIRIWKLDTGTLLTSLVGQRGGVRSVLFLADNKRFLSCGRESFIRMWDCDTGEIIKRLAGHQGGIYDLALVPNSERVVSASYDQTARVWNLESGAEELTFDGHDGPVYCVAVSAAGDFAITGGADRRLRVWNIESGQQRGTFEGHDDTIRDVAISADGRLVYSASDDKTVRVWELATATELYRFEEHADAVRCVLPLPDGLRVLSTSSDGTCRVWELPDSVTKLKTSSIEPPPSAVGHSYANQVQRIKR